MIYLIINDMEFYDDAAALIRSFYPGEKVMVKHGADVTDGSIAGADASGSGVAGADVTAVIEASVPDCEGLTKGVRHEKFKAALYKKLAEDTGRTLPWGDLTGVRPCKIAVGMLESGCSDDDVLKTFRDTHFVSGEKAELALNIAHKEISLLDGINYKDGYSLYIGIPFCPTTCLYCSFTSYPVSLGESVVEDYLKALYDEMRYVRAAFGDKRPDTIYVGGGTPTALSEIQLDRLLEMLDECFDAGSAPEYTVEAGRPDSITRDKLNVLKRHGVGRISINPQTMNQKTLDIIGRRHTIKQVADAFDMARSCGFDNINMDLIMGLPGEEETDMIRTLDTIRAFSPESLTIHSLALKRAAALNIQRDSYKSYSFNNTAGVIKAASECAASMGMEPYYMYRQKNMAGNFENVGYSIPGLECIYNILIMEEKQTIAACGAGASTKLVSHQEDGSTVIERIENVKNVRDYIERIDEMIARKGRLKCQNQCRD